jgi:Flp pilus assembly protein TadD
VNKSLVICVYFALTLSALLVYWQVWNFDFVNFDDNIYVYENLHVLNGLSWDSVVQAFTKPDVGNWLPLTWLSFMFDCQLFGLNAGWMHFENFLLHLANTLLLFAVLKKMSGSLWPSAFVAAAFAIHPMHVESVAWITERKDVLSTLFWMLTLLAYVGYVRQPGWSRYIGTLVVFAAGLMAKPMLITLPFVLVLLDYWPLNRIDSLASLYKAVVEKIPLFVLSIASSVITFGVQRASGALSDIKYLPLQSRVANAFLSCARYIEKMFWPQNLAVFYPYDADSFSFWQVMPCALLPLAISIFVISFGRNKKYLPVGWFWFVITVLPVIGLIQTGPQGWADRYTYIPYIGLFIMIAWGLPDLLSKWPYCKLTLGITAAITMTALGMSARLQTSYWKNSSTLFSHAIAATQRNYLAQCALGDDLLKQGKIDLAIEHYTKALKIRPNYADARNNLGAIWLKEGKLTDAIACFKEALRINPDFADAHNNLGIAFKRQGNFAQALTHFTEAVKFKPDWPAAMANLALLIATAPNLKDRNVNEAIELAERACKLTNYKDPTFVGALAAAYACAGRFSEAVDTARKAASLAEAAGQPQIKNVIIRQLAFYTQGKPYIEPTSKSSPGN